MGVPDPTKELVSKKGIRVDGRKVDEIRPIHIEAGILHRADGSAYLEWGGNKVIAAVYGPRELNPRRFQEADKAVVQCRYSMAAFSTSDRKRPGPDRRSQEISKVISDAFENVVLTEKYPRGAIDIHVEILEANAGTRCAAVVCASVALADAGIPMKGLVSAVAAGKANEQVILDLMGEEDNYGNADLPVGINHTTGEIVLLQMDGHLTPEQFERALDMAVEGNRQVVKYQREALLKRFNATLDEQEKANSEKDRRLEQEPAPRERGERDGGRDGRGRGGDRAGGRGGREHGGR
jgi:exosome complex component RRP41